MQTTILINLTIFNELYSLEYSCADNVKENKVYTTREAKIEIK